MRVDLPEWADWLDVPLATDGRAVRHRVLYGGRGSAKSWTIGHKLVIRALAHIVHILCVREYQNSIRDSSKKLIEESIARLGLQDFFTSTGDEIRGANGSRFVFHRAARARGRAQILRRVYVFPKSHGKPRVDDRRVLSGIVFVNRNGLRWCDAPREYGPSKTLYNRWKRWGERGVFLRMMEGLAAASATPKTIMIDATYLKAHRTASRLRLKRGSRSGIGRTKEA